MVSSETYLIYNQIFEKCVWKKVICLQKIFETEVLSL